MNKVINPLTGRAIMVGGATYRKINATLGGNVSWSVIAPRKGCERHIMKQKCGDQCFLMPQEEKFPICEPDCQISCQGLRAAKIRAHQYKYENLYQSIQQLQNQHCNK